MRALFLLLCGLGTLQAFLPGAPARRPSLARVGTSIPAKAGALDGDDPLLRAVGAGRGKHFKGGDAKKKAKRNKYADASKTKVDPFEAALQTRQEEAVREKERKQRKRSLFLNRRGSGGEAPAAGAEDIGKSTPSSYPRQEDIDPYDPSTFGYVPLGYVLGAHGVRGEVRVRIDTDFAESRVLSPGVRHMKDPSRRTPRAVMLTGGKHQRDDVYLLKFDGVEDRNEAAKLQSWRLYQLEEVAHDEELLEEDDEYFITDLVGLTVQLKDTGAFVGRVAAVVVSDDICAAAVKGLGKDFLELVMPPLPRDDGLLGQERTLLIPFVDEMVPDVDVEAGCVRITPPPGLLDLAVEIEEKVVVKGLLPGAGYDAGAAAAPEDTIAW